MIATKKEARVMNGKRRVWGLIIAMIMMAIFAMGTGSGSSSPSRSSRNANMCENCGRHEKYMGKLCKSCYEDFLEWQKTQN